MDTQPGVSVIIPVYNRVDLLRDALQSVIDQRFSDYEIVVVDDGSAEDVDAVLAEVPAEIRLIRQSNQGAAAARNTGMKAARGRYFAFLDSDDVWLPDKLRKQFSIMQVMPEVGLVYSWYQITDAAFSPQVLEDRCHSGRVYHQFLKEAIYGLMATPTVMIRREVFEQIGGFDETMRFAEDTDFWLRASAHFAVHCIPEALTLVREHQGRSLGELREDPRVHLALHLHMLDKAFSSEPALPWLLRRRLLADAHAIIACRVLFSRRDVATSLRLLLRAFFYFPLPLQGLRYWLRHSLYSLRARLHR